MFATLVPGVQRDRDNQISISGMQPYTTSASIDGITTLNVRLNGPVPELFPSVEGIEEFKISSINNSGIRSGERYHDYIEERRQ